jgi:hypothetical protein
MHRLAMDAAKSRRQRLGLAPHDPLPEEEDNCYNQQWSDHGGIMCLTATDSNVLRVGQIPFQSPHPSCHHHFVTSLLALPVAMGAGATNSAVSLAADAGFTNYAAAEVQARQREELAQMKLQPHDPNALAKQFSHGIDAHVPDGVRTKVDPAEYWKDPETKLTLAQAPAPVRRGISATGGRYPPAC